jgi:hypothetical protein
MKISRVRNRRNIPPQSVVLSSLNNPILEFYNQRVAERKNRDKESELRAVAIFKQVDHILPEPLDCIADVLAEFRTTPFSKRVQLVHDLGCQRFYRPWALVHQA